MVGRKDDPDRDAWRKAWEISLKGPVAVVDCRENIPCNPCEDSCPRGAIVVGDDICALPTYDPESCNGCGRCVAACPGMAIFLMDRSGGKGRVRITVPYEMKGDMAEGEETWAADREGNILGKGKIVGVKRIRKRERTLLVTVEVPEDWALKVRGVKDRVMRLKEPDEVSGHRGKADYPICRCEEITRSYVEDTMSMGFRSLNALRRFSRVGLGVCQGRFCQALLREEFLERLPGENEEVGIFKVRPPVRPVKVSRLGGDDE